ncbi:MAG: hypothetical protein HPY66_0327 [Firmicutes bacterium]|nr:hypothetical protein [Bacillota bacterium]MDI6704748.1 MetS family NSS transporter small subunit [Bacillota bacterium]
MTGKAILMMIIILGINWGGFFYLANMAFKSEAKKAQKA